MRTEKTTHTIIENKPLDAEFFTRQEMELLQELPDEYFSAVASNISETDVDSFLQGEIDFPQTNYDKLQTSTKQQEILIRLELYRSLRLKFRKLAQQHLSEQQKLIFQLVRSKINELLAKYTQVGILAGVVREEEKLFRTPVESINPLRHLVDFIFFGSEVERKKTVEQVQFWGKELYLLLYDKITTTDELSVQEKDECIQQIQKIPYIRNIDFEKVLPHHVPRRRDLFHDQERVISPEEMGTICEKTLERLGLLKKEVSDINKVEVIITEQANGFIFYHPGKNQVWISPILKFHLDVPRAAELAIHESCMHAVASTNKRDLPTNEEPTLFLLQSGIGLDRFTGMNGQEAEATAAQNRVVEMFGLRPDSNIENYKRALAVVYASEGQTFRQVYEDIILPTNRIMLGTSMSDSAIQRQSVHETGRIFRGNHLSYLDMAYIPIKRYPTDYTGIISLTNKTHVPTILTLGLQPLSPEMQKNISTLHELIFSIVNPISRDNVKSRVDSLISHIPSIKEHAQINYPEYCELLQMSYTNKVRSLYEQIMAKIDSLETSEDFLFVLELMYPSFRQHGEKGNKVLNAFFLKIQHRIQTLQTVDRECYDHILAQIPMYHQLACLLQDDVKGAQKLRDIYGKSEEVQDPLLTGMFLFKEEEEKKALPHLLIGVEQQIQRLLSELKSEQHSPMLLQKLFNRGRNLSVIGISMFHCGYPKEEVIAFFRSAQDIMDMVGNPIESRMIENNIQYLLMIHGDDQPKTIKKSRADQFIETFHFYEEQQGSEKYAMISLLDAGMAYIKEGAHQKALDAFQEVTLHLEVSGKFPLLRLQALTYTNYVKYILHGDTWIDAIAFPQELKENGGIYEIVTRMIRDSVIATDQQRLELAVEVVQAILQKKGGDNYTLEHSYHVAALAREIFKELSVSEQKDLCQNYDSRTCEDMEIAALFHDLGKQKIDKKDLETKRKYTTEEREDIKKHPLSGIVVLKSYFLLLPELLGRGNPSIVLSGMMDHHRRMDGSGYPQGKIIHPMNMIISLADECSASLESARIYKTGKDLPTTIAEIQKYKGKQPSIFPETIIDATIRVLEKIMEADLMKQSELEGHKYIPRAPRGDSFILAAERQYSGKERKSHT